MNLDETLVYYCLVCLRRQMHFIVLVLCIIVCSLLCYKNSHFYLYITWQIFISLIFIDIFLRHRYYKRKIMFEHTKYKTNRQRDLLKITGQSRKYIIRYVNVFITTQISEILWVDTIFSKSRFMSKKTNNLAPNNHRI